MDGANGGTGPGSFPGVREAAHPSAPRSLAWLGAAGVLWRFGRPHTVIGTSVGIAAIYVVAAAELAGGDLTAELADLAWVLLAGWCVNVFIVGINQVEDVEIDRVNKPQLPIASGELSVATARRIVAVCAVVPVALAVTQGLIELVSVGAALLIGAAYSCPPVRLKRRPAVAALSIAVVRTLIVNLGVWLHFAEALDGEASLGSVSAAVWALTALTLPYSFAIAVLKDVPDIEGDRRFDIATFSVRLGARPVFLAGLWALLAAQLGIAVAGPLLVDEANGPLLAGAHLAAAALLARWARRLDLEDRAAFAAFYQRVWRLFFAEYAVVAVAVLVGPA
jgi:homogentisate phytyltransferase/homogentisate geranylgeranyltransferase